MEAALIIEKELVDTLKFPSTEVITDAEALANREATLKKAEALGNLNKTKVEIFFEDSEGLKVVNTTVWAITEKNIVLKAGRHIPRNRVVEIRFV